MKTGLINIACAILLIMIVPFRSEAQTMEFSLGIGYQMFRFKSTSFEKLYTSYNSQYSGSICKPFGGTLPTAGAAGYQLRIFLLWGENAGAMFGADFCYSRIFHNNNVEYKNGDRLNVDLASPVYIVGIPIGYAAGPVRVSVLNGIMYMPGILSVYSIYNDDTKSFGVENILHGSYETIKVAWYSGGLISCRLGSYIMLDLTARYLFKPLKNSNPTTFSDNMGERTWNTFPQDIEYMVKNPFESDNVLVNDMRGWMFQLTLNFSMKE